MTQMTEKSENDSNSATRNLGESHRNGSLAGLQDLDRALNYEIGILSGSANKELADEIAKHLKARMIRGTVARFSDGEIRVSLDDNVRGKGKCVTFFRLSSAPI